MSYYRYSYHNCLYSYPAHYACAMNYLSRGLAFGLCGVLSELLMNSLLSLAGCYVPHNVNHSTIPQPPHVYLAMVLIDKDYVLCI